MTPCVAGATLGLLLCSSSNDPTRAINRPPPFKEPSVMAGASAPTALSSVFLIICPGVGAGTGFLHKSGDIITAAHVVHGCKSPPVIVFSSESAITAEVIAKDPDIDIALLRPAKKIDGEPFVLAKEFLVGYGKPVTMWGFPEGYNSLQPMLTTGVVGGLDQSPIVPEDDGLQQPETPPPAAPKLVWRLVVNAAINHGNSGGPLVDVASNEVVGLIVSKDVPLTNRTLSGMKALQSAQAGVVYEGTAPDKTPTTVLEGQVVGWAIEDLAHQVQLVIGRAVLLSDIRSFLQRNNVDP